MASREQNERTFPNWVELSSGGRLYWRDIRGHRGSHARYIKEVDASERTVRFYQEIYDMSGTLIEVHEKYPVDIGHRHVT